jgi:hypothetical protein
VHAHHDGGVRDALEVDALLADVGHVPRPSTVLSQSRLSSARESAGKRLKMARYAWRRRTSSSTLALNVARSVRHLPLEA